MALLHIEHEITDLDAWLEAYNRFAPARKAAGVTEERIWQPVDNSRHVVIELGFGSASAAAEFHTFLSERVWPSSPVMVGKPKVGIFNEVRR